MIQLRQLFVDGNIDFEKNIHCYDQTVQHVKQHCSVTVSKQIIKEVKKKKEKKSEKGKKKMVSTIRAHRPSFLSTSRK